MRAAVTWAVLVVVASIFAFYFIMLEPAAVRARLRQETKDLAETLASRITFVSDAFQSGAMLLATEVTIPESPARYYEIHVVNESGVTKVRVVAVGKLIASEVRVSAEAPFHSVVQVVAPPKLYSGRVIVALCYNEDQGRFLVKIANLMGDVMTCNVTP